MSIQVRRRGMLFVTCSRVAGQHCRQLLPWLTVTSITRRNSSLTPNMSSERRPATPRPSASLIVIDGQNRVLMVERNPNSKSFAGAYVRYTRNAVHPYAHIFVGVSRRKL
jgi:hypothetical protein